MRIQMLVTALAITSLTGCSLFSTPLSIEQRTSEIEIERTVFTNQSASSQGAVPPSLRVLSLNMAHGRKDSFSQIFTSEVKIRQNLAEIAEFLKRENADIVTLQEADSPSWWSGSFNHVEMLAREAGYGWYAHANHVDNSFSTYGTAVLSRHPIMRGYQVDFNPTPPTTRKGFTLAEIEWKTGAGNGATQIIDVVSVHLDFSRRSKRIEQIKDMKAVLGQRDNPVIVLGDFNSTWAEGDREIQSLAKVKKLKTHRPEASYLYTYAEERFDWILISREFEFCHYYTAADILSDHSAVVSEIISTHENTQLADCAI